MARRRCFRAVMALFPALFHAPLGAQPAPQSAVWDVDYGERRCALMRLARDEHPATLSVRTIPGSVSPELHFVDPARTRQPFAGVLRVDITFSPSGEVLRGRGSYTRLDSRGPWVLEVNELPPAFLDRFAQSSSVSIRTGSRPLAEMSIPQAAAAVRALRQCNDALLRNWGVDPAALATLQRQPEIIGRWSDLFRSADYPEEAIHRGISGMSTVRITVGTDGRISDCATLVSSGSDMLDRTTCGILRDRAHLRPGLDSNGNPVAVTLIQSVGWITWPTGH